MGSRKGADQRLYNIWHNIKKRCYYTGATSFKYYGEKGIKVCDEWRHNYDAFAEWAIKNGYNGTLTIDRIDSNGDYSPDNCRLATPKQQAYNRSTNHNITFNGETHALTEWAEILGINYRTLSRRINMLGWSIERALSTPVDMRYSHPPVTRRS